MAPVPVPPEFRVTGGVNTDDVSLIPQGQKRTFADMYESVQRQIGPLQKTGA